MGISTSICSNCGTVPFHDLVRRSREKRKIKLLVLGLDNAGKTTAVMNLLGKRIEDVVPTVGFSNVRMKNFKQYHVEVYDLGGGASIRDIWKNYFALVHGIIFVIDAADSSRLDEVKEAFQSMLQSGKISRKPLLVLFNKQDLEVAHNEVELCAKLNLEYLVNKYKCPTKIETCSALHGYTNNSRKVDTIIEHNYIWLLTYIIRNWDQLNSRVEAETNEQLESEKRDLEARLQKFRAQSKPEDEPTVDLIESSHNGNPFKPISSYCIKHMKDHSVMHNGTHSHKSKEDQSSKEVVMNNGLATGDQSKEVTFAEVHMQRIHSENVIEHDVLSPQNSKMQKVEKETKDEGSKKGASKKRPTTAFFKSNKISPLSNFHLLRRTSQ